MEFQFADSFRRYDWLFEISEVLSFPDYTLPFFMTCDASDKGLGAVLYQKQNGVNRVISFASRTLTDAERQYHSGKLEFLALNGL